MVSETLLPVTLVKRLKAIRKSPGEPNSDLAGFDNEIGVEFRGKMCVALLQESEMSAG